MEKRFFQVQESQRVTVQERSDLAVKVFYLRVADGEIRERGEGEGRRDDVIWKNYEEFLWGFGGVLGDF